MRKPKSSFELNGSRKAIKLDVEEVNNGDMVLAGLVKKCYILSRSRWESIKEGNVVNYYPPKKYDGLAPTTIEDMVVEKGTSNAWLDLVLWCQARDISPESYVRLQFEMLPTVNIRAPEPFQLKSEKYFKLWQTFSPRIIHKIRGNLYSEKERAEAMFASLKSYSDKSITKKDIWASVILSTSLELSPLFRYCLASRIGGKRFNKIASRYEAEAILQLESHRNEYLASWSSFLPPDFANKAKLVYPYLLDASMKA